MAAMAPVMTTRNKIDQSSPWQWAPNGTDAYYGIGASQVAMIGQHTAAQDDLNSRLVINTSSLNNHILLKRDNNTVGRLFIHNTGFGMLLGTLVNGTSLGQRAVGIGHNVNVSGIASIAIGTGSTASGSSSVSTGYNSSAVGATATAIGANSVANGENSTVLGAMSETNAANSIAIGYNNVISPLASNSLAIGDQNEIHNVFGHSIALGNSIKSIDYGGIGIGFQPSVGAFGIAIGTGGGSTSTTAGQQGVSIGSGAVSGNSSIAIGPSSSSNTSDSIAIGNGTAVTGANSIAIGTDSSTAVRATAVGYSARATSGSTALGYDSTAESSSSVAIGETAHSEGGDAVAIGHSSHARNGWSIAIGSNAKAYEANTIAIGKNACKDVTGSNKVCIGADSGPSATSSWASDNVERIFIGGRSAYNNGDAVLEVHNHPDKRVTAHDNMWAANSDSTVVINGNLIVKGVITSFIIDRYSNANVANFRTLERYKDSPDNNASLKYGYTSSFNEYFTYGSAYYKASDRRLKYVGKASTSGLDKIRQLKVFNYTFKKDEKKTPHVGVIAQDLQKVFPDAVSKAKDGFLTIRFEDMFFAMINAIKELDAKYQAQEKRINALEARIEQLEAQIK